MNQEIKNQRAKAAHKRLLSLLSNDVASALEAGRQLDAILHEALWVEIGATSWHHYCTVKLGVTTGWARGRMMVHAHFSDANVSGLTISKLVALCAIFRNKDERKRKKYWLAKARELTRDELVESAGVKVSARPLQFNVYATRKERATVQTAIITAQRLGIGKTNGEALARIAEEYLERNAGKIAKAG